MPKDIVQKDRVPQCFALIPDFPMFPIIDWIIFHQEGKQNPILFFKQATISNVQDHMKRGSDKFGELNAFFEKRNWHYDLNREYE